MKLSTILLSAAATAASCSTALAAGNDGFLASLAAMPRMTVSPVPEPAAPPEHSAPETTRPALVRLATAHPPRPGKGAATPPKPADRSPSELEQKVATQQAQIALLMAKFEAGQTAPKPEPVKPEPVKPEPAKPEQPTWTLANGRPVIASADGHFTLAIRVLGQFDAAYYAQGARAAQLAAANGPDLSTGQNFRRMQLGVQGKAFGDWSYQFNYDFGGTASESPGRIQAAFVEYDGLAPFAVRIGAFPASAGLEDNTSASDTMFLERNAPAELARNIAGGDGRDAIAVSYAGDRVYGALSYTGNKIADAGAFDEQQALLGRLSGLVYASDTAKVVLSANGTYVFKVADGAAGANAPRPFTPAAAPELTVDNTGAKLVGTGALNAEQVAQWGLETAAQWKSFYGQAGYFGYSIEQRGSAAPDVAFSGWYAQASWVLTGESRGYNTSSGAFGGPKPATPFALDGVNWGAVELAARYSALDLNDHAGAAGAATPIGGIRGGEQRIATLGLNWYPNSEVRFELQAQNTQVSRLGTIPAGFGHGILANVEVGQTFNTLALRSQIAF